MIAARYFPRFGTEPGKLYTAAQNARRDISAFFAHTIQASRALFSLVQQFSTFSGNWRKQYCTLVSLRALRFAQQIGRPKSCVYLQRNFCDQLDGG